MHDQSIILEGYNSGLIIKYPLTQFDQFHVLVTGTKGTLLLTIAS